MNFTDYIKKSLQEDSELKKEYDALAAEYELISQNISAQTKRSMASVLEYKGYFAKIEYSAEDGVLYGKVEGIKDFANFESDSVVGIENEFHAAVDDYLELCKKLGQEADKTRSSTFL